MINLPKPPVLNNQQPELQGIMRYLQMLVDSLEKYISGLHTREKEVTPTGTGVDLSNNILIIRWTDGREQRLPLNSEE